VNLWPDEYEGLRAEALAMAEADAERADEPIDAFLDGVLT
jgi:hypothetical protein